jgi:hypothetical protein
MCCEHLYILPKAISATHAHSRHTYTLARTLNQLFSARVYFARRRLAGLLHGPSNLHHPGFRAPHTVLLPLSPRFRFPLFPFLVSLCSFFSVPSVPISQFPLFPFLGSLCSPFSVPLPPFPLLTALRFICSMPSVPSTFPFLYLYIYIAVSLPLLLSP